MTTKTTEPSKNAEMLLSLREAIKAIEEGRDHVQLLVLDDKTHTKTTFFQQNTHLARLLYAVEKLKLQVFLRSFAQEGEERR